MGGEGEVRRAGSCITVAPVAEQFAVLLNELQPVAAGLAEICRARVQLVAYAPEDVVYLLVRLAGRPGGGHVLAAGLAVPEAALLYPDDGLAAVHAGVSVAHRQVMRASQ